MNWKKLLIYVASGIVILTIGIAIGFKLNNYIVWDDGKFISVTQNENNKKIETLNRIKAITDSSKNTKFIYAFNTKKKTASITGYTGNATALNLPSYRIFNNKKYKITQISENAFSGRALTSVKLPKYLTVIDDGAFYNNQISALILPNTLKYIETNAFSSNKITTIQWSTNVQAIRALAFANNQLTDLDLSKNTNLLEINPQAFQNNKLNTLKLPKSLKILDTNAFADNNLTTQTTKVSKSLKSQVKQHKVFDNNGENQNVKITPTYY